MRKNAIDIKNVSKSFFAHKENIEVFKDYNVSFEYGKLYGIMGHSGCGKSTLIKLIGMLESVDSGEILIDDNEASSLSDEQQATLRNEKIGFIFQDYLLDDNLNVYDNIQLPTLLRTDWKEKKDNIIELARKYGIDNRLKHYPKELSGGEQQRVAICRALINNPNIILADEPTGNLDRKNEEIILNDLKELSKNGKCVIVVSHSDNIKKYADKIINLEEGE